MSFDGNNLLEGEVPPLDPDVKVNMSLDQIIRHDKMRAGVSHNLQFGKGKKIFRGKGSYNRRFRRCPFFLRRKNQSQNWRLRGNGPNTPNPRRSLLRWLRRKWQVKPLTSVFHRLSATRAAALPKLYYARTYRPYSSGHLSFLRRAPRKPAYDPHRAKKLIRSSMLYNCNQGIKPEDFEFLNSNLPAQPLNGVNLEKLSEALGGHIVKVKEEESECGETVTTIHRLPNNVCNNQITSNRVGSHAFAVSNQYGPAYSPYPTLNRGFNVNEGFNVSGGYSSNNETLNASQQGHMNAGIPSLQACMSVPNRNSYQVNTTASSFTNGLNQGSNFGQKFSYISNSPLVSNQNASTNTLLLENEWRQLQRRNADHDDTPPPLCGPTPYKVTVPGVTNIPLCQRFSSFSSSSQQPMEI